MSHHEASTTGPIGPELLGRLFDGHAAALELYARQWCDSPEDVVQEALVRLAAEPRRPADPVAWLYRVVRSRAWNASRSARRRKRHETAAATMAAAALVPSLGDSLDAQAAAAALASLVEEEREVVVAHIWGGLTFVEIGQLMSTSDSTAHRRFVAGLNALRQKLRTPCLKNR